MSGLLSQSVGPSVRVDVRIDEDARFAISDANQLELALLNLAVNARDAMPEGGTLTIKAHARSRCRTRSAARRAGGHRYRVGHDGGSASACDRAVLHDQADRPGHRSWPVAGVRSRAGIGRHARDRQRTRTRHDRAHDPPRRGAAHRADRRQVAADDDSVGRALAGAEARARRR